MSSRKKIITAALDTATAALGDKHARLEIWRDAPLAEINCPHPDNPRDIPPDDSDEIRTLDASLAHDYFDPIIWNKRNRRLVSGHVRTPRMIALGYVTADIVVVDYDEDTHRARMIAANAHSGTNNGDKLSALLDSLRKSATDPVLALMSGLDGEKEKPSRQNKPPLDIREVFEVIVECMSEQQQQQLFDRFRLEGIKCRLLTL